MHFKPNLPKCVQKYLKSADKKRPPKDFEEWFYATQDLGFFISQHTGDKYRLDPKQIEWVKAVFNEDFLLSRTKNESDSEVIAFLSSRNKGKTEVLTIAGTAWWLSHYPHYHIALFTTTYMRSKTLVVTIGAILKAWGIDTGQNREEIRLNGDLDFNASLKPYGRDSSARGSHYELVIFDDIIEENDRFQPAGRQRASAVFQEVKAGIAKKIVVIGQLVTKKDLHYELKENVNIKRITSWFGDIPYLDPDLDKLKMDGATEQYIARNYLGYIPDNAEQLFNDIAIENIPLQGKVYAVLDTNRLNGENADWVALTLICKVNDIKVAKGFVWDKPWYELMSTIGAIMHSNNCRTLFYENNGIGTIITKVAKENGIQYAYPFTTTQNKEQKIEGRIGEVKMRRLVLTADTEVDYIDNVISYPNVDHDDAIDCLCMASDIMENPLHYIKKGHAILYN